MEMDQFDTFTRTLSAAGPNRRQTLRALGTLLLGGALGGMAADAAAKAKHHQAKAKRQHASQREGREHGQVQAAGKHRKKHKNKHHDKPKDPPPLPPGCENCAECQMCQDGACVPDPDLERVFCAKSGFACSYCQQGVCTFFQEGCDDGTCPQKGYCCPGQKLCPSIESPTGFFCINEDACCDGKKKCGDQCIPVSSCCDEDRKECGECEVAECVDGEWVCGSQCHYEDSICCNGECLLPCSGNKVINPQTCQCECREGFVDCGAHKCQCYVGDGVRQCMGGGTCCPPSLYCAATMECCFGGFQCTPEGCCDYLWIVDGHCQPPQH